MPATATKLFIGIFTFLAIMAGAWALGLLGPDTRHLPDDHKTPEKCMLWFIGSSSIHYWDSLDRDMKPWVAHNRGIGGATFDDIIPRFHEVTAAEKEPVAIILYAGENDIADGRDVRSVVRNLARFTAVREEKLKHVPLFVMSMKPSPGRQRFLPEQALFNSAVQKLLPHIHDTSYIDITTPLLANGMPREHYREDGIHMMPSGYAIWADVVRTSLKQRLPASVLKQCGETR